MERLDSDTVIQIAGLVLVFLGALWRFLSKDSLKRLEDRIDAQDGVISDRRDEMRAGFKRVDERFARQDKRFDLQDERIDQRFRAQDSKMDDLRLEIKRDIQRLADRIHTGNAYQARSVELLDAIRRGLAEGREPL